MIQSVNIVTVTDRGAGYLCNLIHSAIQNSVNVTIIGWDSVPKPRRNSQTTSVTIEHQKRKLWLYREFFSKQLQMGTHASTLFIVADYDVIVQQNASTIVQQYERLRISQPHDNIIMSSEEHCAYACRYKNPPPLARIPNAAPWRWLNSGLSGGYVHQHVRYLDRMFAATGGRLRDAVDQEAITDEWYRAKGDPLNFIGIDYELDLMVNMHQPHHWQHDYVLNGRRIYHKSFITSKSAPALVHFNGFAKNLNSNLGRGMIYQDVVPKLLFRQTPMFSQRQLDNHVRVFSNFRKLVSVSVFSVCQCNAYERDRNSHHDVCE